MAFYFNDSAKLISAVANQHFMGSDFAISGWVNYDSFIAGDQSGWVGRCAAYEDEQGDFVMMTNASGYLWVDFYSDFGWTFGFTSPTLVTTDTLTPGLWYFVTVSKSGDAYSLYLNGSLQTTQDGSGFLVDDTWGNDHSIFVGRAWNNLTNNALTGAVADFRIYTRALLLNEILSMYHARGRDTVCDSLWLRWAGEEGSGGGNVGSVRDLSGQGRDGTAASTPTYLPAPFAL